jgi:hypothetical protein
MRLLPIVMLLALLQTGSGCSRTCSGENCITRALVHLREPGRNERLRFDFDIAGERASCELPADGDAASVRCSPRVTVSREALLNCQDASSANAVGTSCADSGQNEVVIEVQGSPPKFTVRLNSDQGLISERVFEPTYATSEPNGSGCGTCTQAEEIWNLP